MSNLFKGPYRFFSIILFMLILTSSFSVHAQKKVSVKASGNSITHDLTLEQAKQKALDDAKRDALIKAGVGESITVSDFLYKFEDNEKFQEIFQDFTSTETGGEVMVDSVLSVRTDINEYGNMVVDVTIAAIVFIHEGKEDAAISLKIEGIEDHYKNNSLLKFDVTPSIDGYLKIFNVTDEESSLLYPYKDPEIQYLNDNPALELKALQKITFPVNKAFSDGYSLEISKPEKQKEFDLLIFVFTRKNIAFLDDASDMKQIMSWIYSIPVEERKVVQVGFVIGK